MPERQFVTEKEHGLWSQVDLISNLASASPKSCGFWFSHLKMAGRVLASLLAGSWTWRIWPPRGTLQKGAIITMLACGRVMFAVVKGKTAWEPGYRVSLLRFEEAYSSIWLHLQNLLELVFTISLFIFPPAFLIQWSVHKVLLYNFLTWCAALPTVLSLLYFMPSTNMLTF